MGFGMWVGVLVVFILLHYQANGMPIESPGARSLISIAYRISLQ
jgi:hypothetical protein